MAAARAQADKFDKVDTYKNQIAQLKNLEQLNRLNAAASGAWHVQTVKTISASEALTKQIQQQKLGLKGLVSEMGNYRKGANSALREAIKEQQALRGAMASQMTGSTFGKNSTDLYVPKNLGSELDNARVKYGMINQAIASAAHQTVNWGKNTQWAGRQITVGLTMPLGIAAVGAAALALKVDQELTRIAKVYDTVNGKGIAQEQELKKLREESLEGATRMAQTYGQKMEDILDVEAQLAATGLTGKGLHQSTEQAVRIATLGEMDYQKAVDMTIALQTAFKLSNNELTESFDMMNAVENATSLGIEDIADAVPRAASAIAQLGGSVQDLTVMMTAMKESGVNPAEAANALKSASSRLLDPTAEAITTFKDKFNVDLKEVVTNAKGNVFEIIKTLSGMTKGFSSLDVQQAINDLFGTYQFNRISALWTNLGDAVNGVTNQTYKAMQTVSKDVTTLADIADQELKRKQDSIQGRFKSAVEGIKASLIPLGMTVLGFITPLIEGVSNLVNGFNNLSGFTKTMILSLLGVGAVIGPILMLVGIFANLFGNVVKLSTSLGNLRYRFKAISADEAAQQIMARNASSAFNTEAQGAAVLASTIRDLTLAMEQNAVAQGMMMGRNGQMISRTAEGVAMSRQVAQKKNGALHYTAGSVDAQGNKLGNTRVSDADRAAFTQMQAKTGQIAEDSKTTATNWGKVGKILGGVAAAGMVFATMNTDAGGISDSFMNILMVGTSIGFMFPGIFKGVAGLVGKIATGIKGWGAAATAGGLTKNISGSAFVLKDAFKTGGVKEVGKTIAAMAPRFSMIAVQALKIFGPIGILAAGAIVVKGIVDDMNRMEEQQKALATSGKEWADAIGYTYSPGSIAGLDPESADNATKRAGLVKEMTENQKDLAEALKAAGDEGHAYEASMTQAMRALANGATVAQARKVMEASLDMAGLNPFEIDSMMLTFDKVDLTDPDAIKRQVEGQLQNALSGVAVPSIRPSGNDNDGLWNSMISGFRETFGGDLTSEMRTWGKRAGNALGDGLTAAGKDMPSKVKMFDELQDTVNSQMDGLFGTLKNKYKAEFSDLSIDSADVLMKELDRIDKKVAKSGFGSLNQAEENLYVDMQDGQSKIKEFQNSYEELIDTIVQGVGEVMGWDQSKIDDVRNNIVNLLDLRPKLGVRDSLMKTNDAMVRYNDEIFNAEKNGKKLTEQEKLQILNRWRAKAGLDAATASTQAFGDAAEGAATEGEGMADVIRNITDASKDMYRVTSEDAVNSQKSAMQGAWQDIMGEAERRYDEMRDQVVEGIRARGEASQAGYEREEKAQDNHFDALEKSQEQSFDAQTKATEDYWDAQEKAAQDAADAEDAAIDARIKGIQDTIDAEQKAEDVRQSIFEAAQRRIERLAQSANSNIDFNVALNSGNLDEAAKISNDVSSRAEGWALDDSNRSASEASQARQSELQTQIDDLNTLKEARQAVHDEKIEQIKTARDAALEALKAEQDAQKEALDASRRMAEEDLKSRQDADRRATENHIKAVQDQTEADKRELAQRLRVLQEYIPQNEAELRKHVADVEAVYRDYGIDLTRQGQGWGAVIGDALRTNVDVAAAALQNTINWRQIASEIARQIGEGMGMTMTQVTEFLRTGVWVPPANTANPYTPNVAASGPMVNNPNVQGQNGRTGGLFRHAGGEIPYTGGRSPSQASRVGIPRSAGLYPTEVPMVGRAGEYVVNKDAAQKNKGILNHINNGGDIGGAPLVGPLADYTTGSAALMGTAMAMTAGIALRLKLERGKAEYEAAQAAMAAGNGTVDGGDGPVYQRLFSTIKRSFPRAKLNSGLRPGANDYHGQGMAVDLGEQGFEGGLGRPYLADMNRWIYDGFHGVATELIYSGLGDDRPDIKNGKNFAYSAAIQAQHKNHVHWAMTPAAIALANARGLTGPSAAGSAPTNVTGNQAIVKNLAAQLYGWTGGQWDALYKLVMGESGFRNTAQNPSSTAYGMFQFLNSTWAGTGYAKTSDPTIQTKAGLKYIQNSYGTPINAYAKWSARSPHWYDAGGYLMPGMDQRVSNGTRKPEPVFTAPQWDILKANIGSASYDMGREGLPMPVRVVSDVANGGDTGYNITIDLRGAIIKDEVDFEAVVERVIEKRESRNGRRRVIS